MAKQKQNIQTRIDFDKKNSDAIWTIGLDEVGWGCIAGDLVLGAVAIHKDYYAELLSLASSHPLLHDIRDSKKLTPEKRKAIKELIEQHPSPLLQISLGIESVEYINQYGLAPAFDSCLHKILSQFTFPLSDAKIILDGSRVPEPLKKIKHALEVKGDDKSLAIGLASIIAKETRDAIMEELSLKYPEYCWADNKGYGTAPHTEALKKLGLSPYHREKSSRNILIPK